MVPPTQNVVVQNCGVICALIVILIILGIATWIAINIIKFCKRLQRRQTPPDDPNGRASLVNLMSPALADLPSHPVVMGDITPKAYDITEWVNPIHNGVPNSPFHDGAGNPYCVEFEFWVESAASLAGPWTKEFDVFGYVSFTSMTALQYTEGVGYTKMGQLPPQNVCVRWFRNGTLVHSDYGPINQQQQFSVPGGLVAGGPTKFFRMAALA